MLRSLKHYWRINLAVLLAVAVCGAVLTGALLVGDSVRGSLRDLTLDRLGSIDLALVAERFFRIGLADDLAGLAEFESGFETVVPAIMLRGNVLQADTRARASQVNVMGVDERFVTLFEAPATSAVFQAAGGPPEILGFDFERTPGQVFPSVIINQSLQREIGAAVGDPLLVRFRLGSEVPRDTVLGNRETSEVVGALRGVITRVIPDRGVGRFGLSPHQGFPLNAFVSLQQLQSALEQPGRVNVLLLSRRGDSQADPQPLLERAVRIEDIGLRLRQLPSSDSTLEIQSEEFVLRQALADAVNASASALGVVTLPLQAYLANAMQVRDRTLPYSMALAIDNPLAAAPYGQLRAADGAPAPALGEGEILLNTWAAADLDAQVGDELQLSYYVVGLDEELRTAQRAFRVAGIVAMAGLAVDSELMPDYPGIEGVDNIAQWDPPFPVDLGAIRDVDEAYWDEYRGAPKAFVSAATGSALWSTRYGATTSIRIAVPAASDPQEFQARFAEQLRTRINVQHHGFRFLDVKSTGLEAAGGATDFGGLFIGFSFFLIISAVLIVSLLFTLGIEQGARRLGTLLAIGYPVRRVRRQLLSEGLVIAAAGATLGLVGAVLYGRLLILGLTTLWLPAVGSPLLYLHVAPTTLALGWVIALVVVSASIWRSVHKLRRVPVTRLLAGSAAAAPRSAAPRLGRTRALATGCLLAAAILLAYGLATGAATSPALAFGIGASLLISGLAAFNLWCHRSRGRLERPGVAAGLAMAARNSGWNPGRSMLSVALVASASFVIVTVAGNTRDPESESDAVQQGAGGYTLMATSDLPLHFDLDGSNGRFELGFSEADESQLADVAITRLRLMPGDDASCLNLYSPQRPRVLGLPRSQIERGGFRFAATLADKLGVEGNPWTLLDADLGPGVIPAIGDANSTQWIMHVGLGDDVVMEDERGETIRLRIVATVRESIFQSELLISEDRFLEAFPSQSGFSYFLIDAPEARRDEVAGLLENNLSRFGFDTTSTAAKIAGYLMVQNTYLSTFLMLGGLGLLLGTVGLGIILVRNVIERRAELATLRAFGFQRSFLSRMVLIENAFLLAVGVAIGSLSALIAISPRFLLGALELPWSTLLATLAAVLAVGMLASVVAVVGALRIPLLPALKADR